MMPVCRWRALEPNERGRYACNSPKINAPQGVEEVHCQRCTVRDHEAGGEAPVVRNLAACIFHGDTLRQDGRAVTRECGKCGGKMLHQVVFQCTNERVGGEKIISDCARCPEFKERT